MLIEFIAAAAAAASPDAHSKLCDPAKYVSLIEPDMQYTEEAFNYESYRSAIDWLNRADWKERVEGKTYEQPFELGWEFEMSYFNRLTMIEGYTLKLRALASMGAEKPSTIHEFCTFVIEAVPLD